MEANVAEEQGPKPTEYRKIPLIQHPQDQTGAALSNTPDHQTAPILTYVVTGNILLPLLYWIAQLIKGVFHLDTSFSCWFRGIRVPFNFFWHLQQITIGSVTNFPSGYSIAKYLYITPCPFALIWAVSMSVALKCPSHFHSMP